MRGPSAPASPASDALRAENAERANTYLRQFAALVAHDLAQPVREARAHAARLATRLQGRLDPESERVLGELERANRRLEGLLAGLLEAGAEATLDSQPIELPLKELLSDLEDQFSVELRARDGTLTSDDLPVCRAPWAPLRQALANLIQNGIRHAGSKPPRIHVRGWKEAGAVAIEVIDRGVGFDPKDLPALVRPYRRGAQAAQDPGPALGLGLSLAAYLIAGLGGELLASSKPGQGSSFLVRLPQSP